VCARGGSSSCLTLPIYKLCTNKKIPSRPLPPRPPPIRSDQIIFLFSQGRERDRREGFSFAPKGERVFLLLALSSRLVLEPRGWGGGAQSSRFMECTLIF
jgi:hypothetical protein